MDIIIFISIPFKIIATYLYKDTSSQHKSAVIKPVISNVLFNVCVNRCSINLALFNFKLQIRKVLGKHIYGFLFSAPGRHKILFSGPK